MWIATANADVIVEIANGDTVTGTLNPATEVETFAVTIPEGAKLKVIVKGEKLGNGGTVPARLQLLDDTGTELGANLIRVKKKGSSLSKFIAPRTAEYRVLVSGDGSTLGDYTLKVQWKSPKKAKDSVPLAPAGSTYTFAADRGAFVDFTVAAARGSGAIPRLATVTGPGGFTHTFAQPPDTTTRKHVEKRVLLTTSGEFTLQIADIGSAGGPIAVSLKIKQPKPAKRELSIQALQIGADLLGDDIARGLIIGPAGGSLTLPAGVSATLAGSGVEIPSGALPSSVPIIVGSAPPITNPPQAGLVAAGPAVFFGPPGQQFSSDVTVRLRFDPAPFFGEFGEMRIVERDAGGTVSIVPPATYDVDAQMGIVSFPASHFTSFQVFAPPEPEPIDPVQSDTLTRNAVNRLLRGDDDFSAITADLEEARRLDFRNEAAAAFVAYAHAFEFVKSTAIDSGGTARSLGQRAGFFPTGPGNFWESHLGIEQHLEGDIKEAAPSTSEGASYARTEVRDALAAFLTDTALVTPAFEYRIGNLDADDRFFDGSTADDTESLWIDYGDIQLFRAAVHLALGAVDFLDAYDAGDANVDVFDRADTPDLDGIALFRDNLPTVGDLIRPGLLDSARTQIERSVSAWEAATDAISNESPSERENGLFTPYRPAFRNTNDLPVEDARTKLVGSEATFRDFAKHVISGIRFAGPQEIGIRPDGVALPTGRRHSIDLDSIFTVGLDPRAIYSKTITDPFTGRAEFGVGGIDEITEDMQDFGDVIGTAFGVVPGTGDVLGARTEFFGLRIESPANGSRTVDGSLGEWNFGVNSTQIVEEPTADVPPGATPFGDLHIATDGTNLYFAHTGDPDDHLKFRIHVVSPSGSASASKFTTLREGSPFRILTTSGSVADPTIVEGAGATEVAVPLSNFGSDTYVRIRFSVGNAADPDNLERDLFRYRYDEVTTRRGRRRVIFRRDGPYPPTNSLHRNEIFVKIR